MNECTLKMDIEPTNKYEKAKKDLAEALLSFSELSSMEREQLVKELFGAEAMRMLYEISRGYFV